MNPKKDFSDIFDDDFEVTYDENLDISPEYSQDPDHKSCSADNTFETGQNYDDDYDAYTYQDDDYADDEYTDDDYDRPERKKRSGRRRRSGVHLAAPIQQGGRTLSRISGVIIRQLSLILILAVSVYVTYTFWRASVPYGDITESVREKTFSHSILAYLCVMAVFLLFELVSFFWAMTRIKVRDAGGVWKEDTGRGLTSFIIVFVFSYLAFLFNQFVPSSPELLFGLKGALLVYGSMHNTLLGLCAAGVISCLIRKYMVR